MNACAKLPVEVLPHLARWRDRGDVRVVVRDSALWVFWPASAEEVARHVLALPGAEPATLHEGSWRRPRESLPVFDVPDPEGGVLLDRVLFPEVLTATPVMREACGKMIVRLVRDDCPRRTTALRVSLAALAAWADSALSDDIEAVEAAISGNEVLLRGRLPALVGERFWGQRLLIAAGWRPEPDLAEGILVEALGFGEDCGVFTPEGVEVVPAEAFGPLTRAGVRLASRAGGVA